MAQVSGGDRLEKYLADLAKKLARGATLNVGFLEGATYPDGTPVAMVAAIQNYGAPRAGIPRRAFFTDMVVEKSPGWGPALGELLEQNDMDAGKALAMMGEGIKGQLQESIVETFEPALSPVTLMLRKMRAQNPDLKVTAATVGEAARRVKAGETASGVSTKPLVDTGHLLASADYEVKT